MYYGQNYRGLSPYLCSPLRCVGLVNERVSAVCAQRVLVVVAQHVTQHARLILFLVCEPLRLVQRRNHVVDRLQEQGALHLVDQDRVRRIGHDVCCCCCCDVCIIIRLGGKANEHLDT